MLDLLLKNVRLPEGRVVDVSVSGGLVVHVGAGGKAGETIDCSGLLVLPGGVDMHVHMRGGPRESRKEDWGSGSRAALPGGVTLVVDQPNTNPPLITARAFRARVKEAEGNSLCHFALNGGAVPGAPVPDLWRSGAMAFGEIFYSPSTGSSGVSPDGMGRLLGEIHALGAPCTIHAEKVREAGAPDLASHSENRPAEGEVRAVEEVKGMVPAGMRLHFCHLSTADAMGASVPFTSEVTPHHLLLSQEDFRSDDPRGKVNPPLRGAADRIRLFSSWDRISVLASDHAPHTLDEKSGDFATAPAGIPGVETMIPLLIPKVFSREITPVSLVAKTSANPCSILGIPAPGFSPGDRADFALFPAEVTTVQAKTSTAGAGGHLLRGMKQYSLKP